MSTGPTFFLSRSFPVMQYDNVAALKSAMVCRVLLHKATAKQPDNALCADRKSYQMLALRLHTTGVHRPFRAGPYSHSVFFRHSYLISISMSC